MRRKIAFWICPDLREEIAALLSGNTKCVLENGKLMDEIALFRIERMQNSVARWMETPEVNTIVHQRP